MNKNSMSDEMYGISRIDSERYNAHAWRVSLSRRGKRYVKNFTDKKWQCQDTALQKAKEYRDQLLLKYPPLSRKEFCNVKRRNNKTGITGVYRYSKNYKLKDGTIMESWYWEANWPAKTGESICKSFSVKRYGESLAKRLATQARVDGMQSVRGIFWAAQRGEVNPIEIISVNRLLPESTRRYVGLES